MSNESCREDDGLAWGMPTGWGSELAKLGAVAVAAKVKETECELVVKVVCDRPISV